jgi:hypothetical protein
MCEVKKKMFFEGKKVEILKTFVMNFYSKSELFMCSASRRICADYSSEIVARCAPVFCLPDGKSLTAQGIFAMSKAFYTEEPRCRDKYFGMLMQRLGRRV